MIEIIERSGVDDAEVVAQWSETDGWIYGGDRFSFMDDEHYTTELMVDRFDGPTHFAIERESKKAAVGPPMSTTMGVGEVEQDVAEGPDEDDEEDEEETDESH